MLRTVDLPEKGGVYLFKNAKGKILYIGKAVNLKKRVRSYFRPQIDPRLQALLAEAKSIDCIITKSERDSLFLEFNLIQKHNPPYNIRLKDNRSFPWIVLTSDEYPALILKREPQEVLYRFGPLLSLRQGKPLLDVLYRFFQLRQCSNTLFKKRRVCIYYHLERCSAPCAGKVSPEDYRQKVKAAIFFLSGKITELSQAIRRRMWEEAERQNFEAAEQFKQDLELIESFNLNSLVYIDSEIDFDLLLFRSSGEKFFAHYEQFRNQKMIDSGYFQLYGDLNDEQFMREVLVSFYRCRPLCSKIFTNLNVRIRRKIQSDLNQLFKKKLIVSGSIVNKNRIFASAVDNLNYYLLKSDYSVIENDLRQTLGTELMIRSVEAVDISHFAENFIYGAIVRFNGGIAEKRGYRNYRIRSSAGGDPAAIAEVLERRIKYGNLPNLFLIDGGLSQLNAALGVKNKHRAKFLIIALAKSEERLFLEDGRSILLPVDSPLRLFLQLVRDEVHRRALRFHQHKREALS